MQNYGNIEFSPLANLSPSPVHTSSVVPITKKATASDPSPPLSNATQDVEQEGTEESSSVAGASFNLINSIVGSGIIGIPFAIQQCGLVVGIAMLSFIAYLIYNSVVILIECGIRENKFDFEELSEHLLGKRGYYSTLLFMFLFALGGMTSYLVILADIVPSFAVQFAPGTLLTSRHFVLAVVSVVVILPISLLKDISSLSWSSLLSISADGVIILIVLAAAFDSDVVTSGGGDSLERGQFDATDGSGMFNSQLFAGIGTMSFAFVCQHNSFLVYRSLRPALRNKETWKEVAGFSVFTAYLLCALLGLAGFFTFYPHNEGDLLNNYPDDSVSISVARMLLAMAMVFTYPMEMFVARHCLLSVYYKWKAGKASQDIVEEGGVSRQLFRNGVLEMTGLASQSPMHHTENETKIVERVEEGRHAGESSTGDRKSLGSAESPLYRDHLLVTLMLWIFTVSVAMGTDQLGIVTALSGAVAASMIGFVLPAMIYFQSHRTEFQYTVDQVEQQLHGTGRVTVALDLTRVILDGNDLSSNSEESLTFGASDRLQPKSTGSDDSYDFTDEEETPHNSSNSSRSVNRGVSGLQSVSMTTSPPATPPSRVWKGGESPSQYPDETQTHHTWDGGATQTGRVPVEGWLISRVRSFYRTLHFYGLVLVMMPPDFRLPLCMGLFGVAALFIGVVTVFLYA
jgi:sodium-coupled neutral amino acid transporter 11